MFSLMALIRDPILMFSKGFRGQPSNETSMDESYEISLRRSSTPIGLLASGVNVPTGFGFQKRYK